ncbi:MAG: hypothetical protein H6Q18_158 [Bacteroidetes bacterium]|nr:hypothetical protein [Bacteroidota bacterium]
MDFFVQKYKDLLNGFFLSRKSVFIFMIIAKVVPPVPIDQDRRQSFEVYFNFFSINCSKLSLYVSDTGI